MSYVEDRFYSELPDYDRDFWSFLRGNDAVVDKLHKGRTADTGTYILPAAANDKYEKAIAKESVFRSIASVFTNYDGPAHILAANSDDIAEYVPEFGTISIKDVADDFTRIPMERNKLATLLRLPTEFIRDAAFDLSAYLVKRLAKAYARAEDQSFIVGSGDGEPVGILSDESGANVAVTAQQLSYDDVLRLYYAVAPKHRQNAVWLMNDETALTLRSLKDENGNYLWRDSDDTILGKKVLFSEYMPNIAAGAKPIAFGDFSYYWIVKRSPVTVKTLKELFALHGQTGYLSFEFLDGKLIDRDAVQVIQIESTEPEDIEHLAE